MSWGSRLPSFMSFGLCTACWDTPCRCEEKQQLLPHTSHLNPSNPQLHDTLVPGGFNTCTRALKTNKFREIDHNNLRSVHPTGSPISSASAVPTNSLTPFVFNIETPSRFENTHTHNPPPSAVPPLQWGVSTAMLSDGANTTTNANQRKRKSSNAGTSTMGKRKTSIADACTMGPSKRQRQNSPNPTLVVDTALKSHIRSASPTPSPALSSVSLPFSTSESFYSLPPSSNHPIRPNVSKSTATDLWWFFIGVTSNDRPPLLPPVELPAVKSMQPNTEQFPYVRCALW